MLKKDNEKGLLPYYNSGNENKLKTDRKKRQKSDLVATPNIQTLLGSQAQLNWPWFRQRVLSSTGSSFTFMRNLRLKNPSTKMGGGYKHDQLYFSPTQLFLLYNWSLRSTESYHGRIIQHLDFNL